MDLEQARQRAAEKIDALRSVLEGVIDENFDLYLVGSLGTGSYDDPKRSVFSVNADCPFPEVIEADLRLVLSESHPHDDSIIQKIGQALGAENPRKKTTVHWDRTDIPMSVFFWYDEISEDLGFEWEFCINQQPYSMAVPRGLERPYRTDEICLWSQMYLHAHFLCLPAALR